MQAKRLSGWTRLFIVALVPIWAVTTWVMVDEENVRWRSACNWNGCTNFIAPPARYDDDGNPIFVLTEIGDGEAARNAQVVRAEIERRAVARQLHRDRLIAAIVTPLVGSLIAFVALVLVKVAVVWVWRGFRPRDRKDA
jgi:hypothetical protein